MMLNYMTEVEFLGTGMMGCPFVSGNCQKLIAGVFYLVKSNKTVAGMLMLDICDTFGNDIGCFPSQWFNPTYRPLMTAI